MLTTPDLNVPNLDVFVYMRSGKNFKIFNLMCHVYMQRQCSQSGVLADNLFVEPTSWFARSFSASTSSCSEALAPASFSLPSDSLADSPDSDYPSLTPLEVVEQLDRNIVGQVSLLFSEKKAGNLITIAFVFNPADEHQGTETQGPDFLSLSNDLL